jgi:hypothetical protein
MTNDSPSEPPRTPAPRDRAKERFGFESWPRPAPASEPLPRVRFLPSLDACPDLELLERFPRPGRAFHDHLALGGDPAATVGLTVWEETSAADAQNRLLEILANSMAPSLPTLAERGLEIGDVGFTDPHTPISAIVFVRGRIVIDLVARQGRDLPVVDLARALDRQIQAHLAI